MTTWLALVLAQETALLRYRVEAGQVHRYESRFEYEAEDGTWAVIERTSLTIGEPTKPGLNEVKTETVLVKHVFDSQEFPASARAAPILGREERDSRGQVLRRAPRPEHAAHYARMLRVLDVVYLAEPVSVGDSWRRNAGRDEATRAPAATWTWSLAEIGPKEATIEAQFTETEGNRPVTGEGRFFMDRASGWPVRGEMVVTGLTMPGDELDAPATLTVTLTRLP